MELDWTTLLIQIVNFLILVWILKRFLYRPVLEVIERRRDAIGKALDEAKVAREAADHERHALRERLAAWEREQELAHQHLEGELESERTRQRDALDRELNDERLRHAALRDRRLDELQRLAEERAMEQAAAFAASLLGRITDKRLDIRLTQLLLEELGNLPVEQRHAITSAAALPETRSRVTCASELPAPLVTQLTVRLQKLFGLHAPVTVRVDSSLIGGIRIDIGPWSMAASLQDELAFFRHGATRTDG